MHARHLAWIGLVHAAFVVGCGTQPMPKGSAAAPSAIAKSQSNRQMKPPQSSGVQFEDPNGVNGTGSPSRAHSGQLDPDELTGIITKNVEGYEQMPPRKQPRPPKLTEPQPSQAEPSNYREQAGSQWSGSRPPRAIRPTPFPQPPPEQPAPPPQPTPPAAPPPAPAPAPAPSTDPGIRVLPPGGLAGGEGSFNLNNRPTSGITSESDILTRQIFERLQNNPQDLEAHLLWTLLSYIKGDRVPKLDHLASLPQEDREFFAAFADMLVTLPSALRDSGAPSRRTKVLMDMVERLRTQAELTLPTLALCSRVSGFGVYDPMTTRFVAGTDHPVIIYCEVENFLSKLNERQMWETKLSLEVVLYTPEGYAVLPDGKHAVPPDLSRNRRHDFFVIKHMTLPRTLSIGRYVMKVTIVDENAHKVAENNLEISLTAQ